MFSSSVCWLKLTILVNDINTIVVFEKCLCAMFGFQLGSLHMSKDATYDVNNNVSSLVYQMLIATTQGQEWVVSSRFTRLWMTMSLFIPKKPF
jgi:hypothetical protein